MRVHEGRPARRGPPIRAPPPRRRPRSGCRARAGARSRGRSRRPIDAVAIRRGDRVPAVDAPPPQPRRSGRVSSGVRAGGPGSGRASARSRGPGAPRRRRRRSVRHPGPGRPGRPTPRPGRHRGELRSCRARHHPASPARHRPRRRAARHRAGTGPRGSGHPALGRAPTPARRPRGRPPARVRGAPPAVGSGAVATNQPPRRLRLATKCEGRHRPQHEVDRIVREQPTRDRVHAVEAGRSQRDGRRRPHRCRAETLAGRDAREPSDDQRERGEHPDRLESETKARRAGDEPRVTREREQVVRAKRASGRDGIEGQGRHEPEDHKVGDVRPGHDQSTGPTGPDGTARLEHGVRQQGWPRV